MVPDACPVKLVPGTLWHAAMKFVTNAPGRVTLVPEEGEAGRPVDCLMCALEPLVYDAMCDALPDGARAAEVGCFHGGSAAVLAHGMRRRGKALHLSCHDLFEPFEVVPGETHDVEREFDATVEAWGVGAYVRKVKGDSKETHAVHPDASLDYVFVDGDHSYEGALADIRNFSRALKPGGWLLVQDCTNEVMAAVIAHFGEAPRLHVVPPGAHHLTIWTEDAAALRACRERVGTVLEAGGQQGSSLLSFPPV